MSNVHQCFRQGLTGNLVHLEVFDEPETNQQVIYWDDITKVFPTARHVKNGPVIVSFARNKQRQWCEPRCIRHYPGDVLEVIDVGPSGGGPQFPSTPKPTNLSTTNSSNPAMKLSHVIPAFPSTPVQAIGSPKSLGDMSTDHHFNLESLALQDTTTASVSSPITVVVAAPSPTRYRVLKRAQTMHLSSSAQLLDFETSAQSGVQGNAVIQQGIQAIQNELRENFPALRSEIAKNTALQQEMLKLQERSFRMEQEMLKQQERTIRMQQEALDRVALIQNKVAAIMTQSYELHEYPIPRLFIVLPKESASRTETLGRGIKNLFANQFTLYFLCECGEHTKPVDGQPTNPNLKHEIHIARHKGYDIDRPTEFFKKYGSYILTLLQMLKYGVTIAGVVVPPLSQLNIEDAVEGTLSDIKIVLRDLGPKVDSSIAYIEGLTGAQSQLASSDSGSTSVGLGGVEALEGADLRNLESFLKTSDKGRVLGNLYRIVTSDGHVKWVCLYHYRENYRAKAAQDLRDAIQGLEGWYDESTGSARVNLSTPIAARTFYAALASSRSVQSLDVRFGWAPSMQDLRDFRDAVKSTNIFEVTIKKSSFGTPRSDVFNNGRRSDPLLQMMSGGNIQTFRLSGWDEGFLGHIGTIPTTLTVRNLVIDMQYEDTRQKRIPRLVSILQASPVLSYLSLSAFHIDYYADRLLPALEKAKLPRELEVILESDDYSRVSFKVEAHTGRVRPIDVRYRSDCRTKFLYRPSVQHIHFVRPELLTTILGDLWLCLRNNTGLESVKVNCSSDDFIEWLQSIHRVFTDYSQLTTQLYFLGSKSTLSTCNIQDLSTTAIRLDRLSNKHLSAGYLGTVQDDWTFAVNMLVLATNTKPTDITTLAQFLRPRPDRFSFPALELTIDDESDLTIVPPLIKLLEECQALQDTRIRLNLNYEGRTRLFTDITSQDAARHLTRFNSSVSRSNLVMEFF